MGTYSFRELSRFVLSRGLTLCALLLGTTVALLLRAGQGGALAARFYTCADAFQFAALLAFASALLGSVLMEDLLRYYGE